VIKENATLVLRGLIGMIKIKDITQVEKDYTYNKFTEK